MKIEDDTDAEKYIHECVKEKVANRIAITTFRMARGENLGIKDSLLRAKACADAYDAENTKELKIPTVAFDLDQLPRIGTSVAVTAAMALFSHKATAMDYNTDIDHDSISEEAIRFGETFCRHLIDAHQRNKRQ